MTTGSALEIALVAACSMMSPYPCPHQRGKRKTIRPARLFAGNFFTFCRSVELNKLGRRQLALELDLRIQAQCSDDGISVPA